MKKLLFIVNPWAGQRKILWSLADVIAILGRAGYEVTIYMTEHPGHAQIIARDRAGEFDRVVCAGGDGTLNECVSGMLEAGWQKPIGYLPCGSTNDFAATLRLPGNPVEAAKAAAGGEPQPHDVGKFGERYFTYVASFGVFTKTSYATAQSTKNLLGRVAYWLAGLQELGQIKKNHVVLECDGETIEGDFIFGAVTNSTSVGGVLSLDPNKVELDDGKFELFLLRPVKDPAQQWEAVRAIQEKTYDCEAITFRSFRELTIRSDPEMVWSLDGERAQGSEVIRVENLHQAIQIVHPREEP